MFTKLIIKKLNQLFGKKTVKIRRKPLKKTIKKKFKNISQKNNSEFQLKSFCIFGQVFTALHQCETEKNELVINENQKTILINCKSGNGLENGAKNKKMAVDGLKNYLLKNYLMENVEKYSRLIGVKPGTVKVKLVKSKWGSCSKSGNLNFNLLILCLPKHLIDYVIVHELCHLMEFNHSKKFWILVKTHCPNYKQDILEIKNLTREVMNLYVGLR